MNSEETGEEVSGKSPERPDLGLIYHEDFLLHEHSPTHPERRERLMYTMDQLREEGIFDFPGIRLFEPEKATRKQMSGVHTEDYLDELKSMSSRESGKAIDTEGETIIQESTYEQAKLAAGGAILASEVVLAGEADRSFLIARPGGHHAFSDHGHGFCFTNNLAIMIENMKEKYELERILVWDWDAHHFDGTQSIFYSDPSVLTISTHQDGKTLFPGSGFVDEIGKDEGEGFNVNVPLPPRTSDEGYMKAVKEVFVPLARSYQPDAFVIQAGQDNHFTDPITNLNLTAEGYSRMMEKAVEVADELCEGEIIAALGGGYGIEGGLPYTNLAVIASLAGLDTENIREPKNYNSPNRGENLNEINRVLERVKDTIDPYHSI